MYHHFHGKPGLALAAISRSAEELRGRAEAHLSGPGTAVERITGYLRRERDALSADADRLDALGRAVHDALVETMYRRIAGLAQEYAGTGPRQ